MMLIPKRRPDENVGPLNISVDFRLGLWYLFVLQKTQRR